MRNHGPLAFMRLAGTFVLVASGLLAVVYLGAQAAVVGAVAAPVDPDDDSPWVQLAPLVAEWDSLDHLDGLSREQVVARLGVPLRVHRDQRTCDSCFERYVYAFQLDSERVPIAVCFTGQGVASGTCGGSTGGMQFDLRSMTEDGVGGLVFSWPLMVLLSVPFAVLRRGILWIRPIRILSIR